MVSPNRAHYDFDVSVPQSVIDQIREYGMEASVRMAKSGTAPPDFVEGVRRFYPMAFQDEPGRQQTVPEPDPVSGIDTSLSPEATMPPDGNNPFYASVDGEIDPNLLAAVYRQFGLEPPRGEAPGPAPHPMDEFAEQILQQYGLTDEPIPEIPTEPEAGGSGSGQGLFGGLAAAGRGYSDDFSNISQTAQELGPDPYNMEKQGEFLDAAVSPLSRFTEGANSTLWRGLDAISNFPGGDPLTHQLGISPHSPNFGQPSYRATPEYNSVGVQGPQAPEIHPFLEETLQRRLGR